MSKERILREVESRIRDLPGVVDLIFLDSETKNRIVEIEREAETNGAAGGLMPFRNLGVWETLSKEVCLIVVLESGTIVLGESKPVIMVDGRGRILGEFVNEERGRQLRDREDVHFLSDDFVIYADAEIEGDAMFIMPVLEFEYIDDVEGIERVSAGSISTLSDHFIRCMMGFENTTHWTHLVGFDLL